MGKLGWKFAEPAQSAGPWLPTVALLASRPQRPQDAHAPGAALQAGNARPWPVAGYIHPRHHCAVASLVHRLFSSRVDALESQVQFCWQEAHGERHEANHISGAPQRRIAVQWSVYEGDEAETLEDLMADN